MSQSSSFPTERDQFSRGLGVHSWTFVHPGRPGHPHLVATGSTHGSRGFRGAGLETSVTKGRLATAAGHSLPQVFGDSRLPKNAPREDGYGWLGYVGMMLDGLLPKLLHGMAHRKYL